VRSAGAFGRGARSAIEWSMAFLLPQVCPRCRALSATGGLLCTTCRAEAILARSSPRPPLGLEAIACGPELVPPVRILVHGLKYGSLRSAADELVSLAGPAVPDGFCHPGSVLVPVPLHPSRLRERGYNQSALSAKAWARRLGVPVAERWLERRRPTGTQTRLGSADRRRNLSQAFAVGKEFKSGAPVVLVDDVLTTGATLSACAAVLLAAGASSVRGLCLAWAGDA